jgi:hypothetical protein
MTEPIPKPSNYTKMNDMEYYEYLKKQNKGKPLYEGVALDKETMGQEAYYKALKERNREEWAKAQAEGKSDTFLSWATDNPDNDSKRIIEQNRLKARENNPKGRQPALPPKDQLNVISNFFLNTPNGKYSQYEMEAKFGTRGIKPITKLDYDNVVKKLKSLGFISANEVGF